jgi:phenylpropionate dioxygenase-like ring-hydroxylating dioxygenase large terminal subunit
MLTSEENELICRVGPGTPMGNLMRQYWIPGMLSSELPHPDCPPVRVMLLGEPLIAFRDSEGRVALIQNYCPHRGASLFYARIEEGGLRCVYHGWKFDVDGNCLDQMSEPEESDFREKVRALTYPCRERNGAVWVYMGSERELPPLPDIEANIAEDYHTLAMEHDHNYLQVLEGTIDTIHAGILHSGATRWEDQPEDSFSHYYLKSRKANFKILETPVGACMGTYRDGPPGMDYWRIAEFLMPFYGISPTGGGFQGKGRPSSLTAAVPMDDEHTLYVHFIAKRALDHYELLPNTSDWYGRFRPAEQPENDFMLDRDVQRNSKLNSGGRSYTGIPSGRHQDRAMTSSMGTIYDRSHEHLGTSDSQIIRTRRRLIRAAIDFAETGAPPAGVLNPEFYQVRTGEVFLPKGADWVEETKELRKAFVEHAV